MKHYLSLVFIALITFSCKHSTSQNVDKKILDWGNINIQQIESLDFSYNKGDLKLLDNITTNAEVICLGESRHDIREQFLLKNRLVKYLVEKSNFKTFALEGCLSYSQNINDYITNGTGSLDEIMAGMPGWFIWDTEEMKTLIEWFYIYNQSKPDTDKIKFYGIDIVAPNHALNQIFEYLNQVDKFNFKEIQDLNYAQDIIVDTHWPTTMQNYSSLSESDKIVLKNNYDALYNLLERNRDSYISESSKAAYHWALVLAYSAKEANNMFSEVDRIKMGLIRDTAMANIALWVKERNEKLLIWAHNVHIAKSEFSMNMFPNVPIQGMGYLLHEELGEKMISIGASFNQGEFESENRSFQPAATNSIDGVLAAFEIDYFLLDLKGVTNDESVKNWLNHENTMRGQEFEMTCIPSKAFDAFLFTETISKVKYNRTTLERLRN